MYNTGVNVSFTRSLSSLLRKDNAYNNNEDEVVDEKKEGEDAIEKDERRRKGKRKDGGQPEHNETTSMVSSFLDHSHWIDLYGNSEERKQFLLHRQREFSRMPLLILFALVTLTLIVWSNRLLVQYPITDMTYPVVITFAGTIVSLFIYMAIECSRPSIGNTHFQDPIQLTSSSNCQKRSKLKFLRDALYAIFETLLYFAVCLCGQLFVIILVDLREEHDYAASLMPEGPHLPDGFGVLAMMLPAIVYLVFKGVQYRYVIYVTCILFATDLYLMLYYHLHQSFVVIVGAFLFSLFVSSEYHRQCWGNFLIKFRLQHALGENARMAEEIKANELRHMIGNVAHDLKTPLSSFISGMEVIHMLATELRNDLAVNQTVPDVSHRNRSSSAGSEANTVQGKLSTILEVAENVTNTNAFMIMTINRCIDYNKTLFGLKLSPKCEVFRLKDCVDFTIKCLKNSFSQASFVCDFEGAVLKAGEILMMSDKQWLQENLLCLMGNAVKYSPAGSIVRLVVSVIDNKNDQSASTTTSVFPSVKNATHETLLEAGLTSISEQTVPTSPMNRSYRARIANPRTVDNTAKREGALLKFAVLDCGQGVPIEVRRKLFEEPAQAARINGGTGLGLYSLAKRVDALNGDYGMDHRMDGHQGSIFWFTIPLDIVTDNELINNTKGLPNSGGGNVINATLLSSNSSLMAHQPSTRNFPHIVTSSQPYPSNARFDIAVFEKQSPSRHSRDDNSGRCSVRSVHDDVSVASVRRRASYQHDVLSSFICLESQLQQQDQIKPPEKEVSGKQLHVLVVDDSMAILKMTSLALKKQGYQVSTAENGQLAVDKFKELASSKDSSGTTKLDVILMDFQMPVMDGVVAIQKIRQLEAEMKDNKNIDPLFVSPIIIGFSAKSDEEQIESAYEYGMDGFLPKPFTIHAFQSLLAVCKSNVYPANLK